MNVEKREKQARKIILQVYGKNVNCFRYHLELVKRLGRVGEPYYNGDHVLTLLPNGNLYDKTGMVFYPMKSEPRIYEEAHSWGDINEQPPTVEERLTTLERMAGIKNDT